VTALVAVLLMANVLHRMWSSGQQAKISLARFVTEGRNDLVSCAPLGMRPDGQPDGIVEISYRLALPPMTLLACAAQLRQRFGWFATARQAFTKPAERTSSLELPKSSRRSAKS